MIRITAVLVLACAMVMPASAEPTGRVLLADADPELRRAIETTLAPWKLEVVVEDAVPVDAMAARERADAQTVRFVVWREGTDLVVFDRARGEAEHREAPVGALDAVSAAAAALTVKTLMRLPPPPPDEITQPAVVPVEGPELRVQAGIASRLARGSTTDLGGRGQIGVQVRPWFDHGWRFGVAGELGLDTAVHKGQYRGTWSDWMLLALTSWGFERGPWEIEFHAGAGVLLGELVATDNGMPLPAEHETLGVIRGGTSARRRLGRWSAGFAVDGDGILGTPTYTRANGQTLFQPPAFAFAFGVFAAADLGR